MKKICSIRTARPAARKVMAAGATAVLAAGLLTACGTGSTKPSSSSAGKRATTHTSTAGKVLTVTTGAAGTFADNFNPFSPNAEDPARGMIYEPLWFFDTADAGRSDSWLATSYAWSDGGKTLTFHLRHGVQWSDGTPFTSADVAYTFNLIKSNSALNGYGLPLAKATTDGAYTAVVHFTRPAYSDLNYAAGLTYIVPEHIWKSIKDPATFLDTKPVGTGAYEVSRVAGSVMKLTANPHYYMAGMPHFKTIEFLSFKGNTSSDLAIENGSLDWAGSYIPNIKREYLAKNSKFVVSDIPLSVEFLVPNLKNGPTRHLAVREALSDAVNRPLVSADVYQGYAEPTSPTGLLVPNFKSVLDPSLASTKFTYSPSAAKKLLEAAGYKLGSDGIFDSPSGKPLDITVQVVSGYTDYIESLQIIAQEMKAAGIDLTVDQEAYSQFTANQDSGNFQMLIDNFGYTPQPYVYYNDLLDGASTPAIGQTDTVGNYGRYNNPTVNAALTAISAAKSTSSVLNDYYIVEKQFLADEPLIPLFDQQDEQEFNGNVVTGEPTPSDPYAADAVYIAPDLGWVAMRLRPAS
jgi:peptide/nickel transport system substrate-binding protein